MEKPMVEHQLFSISVEASRNCYTNTDNYYRSIKQYGPYSVARSSMALLEQIPVALDRSMNRYTTAIAIQEALDLANKQEFLKAITKLQETIETIKRSVSGDDKTLTDSLKDCCHYVSYYDIFSYGGASVARMIVSEFYMEYIRIIPVRATLPTPQLTYVNLQAYDENS
jgi:hypothetical protein